MQTGGIGNDSSNRPFTYVGIASPWEVGQWKRMSGRKTGIAWFLPIWKNFISIHMKGRHGDDISDGLIEIDVSHDIILNRS
jgi:hypothetical protein